MRQPDDPGLRPPKDYSEPDIDPLDPPDPFDPARDRRVKVERTMDELRERFGKAAIAKGRGLDRAPN